MPLIWCLGFLGTMLWYGSIELVLLVGAAVGRTIMNILVTRTRPIIRNPVHQIRGSVLSSLSFFICTILDWDQLCKPEILNKTRSCTNSRLGNFQNNSKNERIWDSTLQLQVDCSNRAHGSAIYIRLYRTCHNSPMEYCVKKQTKTFDLWSFSSFFWSLIINVV